MKLTQTSVVVAFFVLCVVLAWIVRLRNPALTETQLVIEFWPLWLAMTLAAGGLSLWQVKK